MALVENYSNIVAFLMKNGAMLNTLRPEYMLNYQDYNIFIRTIDNPTVMLKHMKLTDKKHR